MGFLKKAFLLGLVGALGWAMYYAGENNLFSFLGSESEQQFQRVKKDRAVKAKSFFRTVKEIVPAPIKNYDYTFFETLGDAAMDRYVDLDGKVKVMKKTVHSWVDGVEKVIDEPHVILASYQEPDGSAVQPSPPSYQTSYKEPDGGAGKPPSASYQEASYQDIINRLDALMKDEPKKKVAPPTAPPSSARRAAPVTVPRKKVTPSTAPSSSAKRAVPSAIPLRPYMVQVSSFKKLTHARALASKLKRKGYRAFVMSVQVSQTKGRWYRVFLGKYQTQANARAAAQKAQRLHKLKTLVLKASR